MRRWILIVVALATAAGVVGAAVAILNLEGYLEANRDWLEAQLGAAAARDVSFGRVAVSFEGGLGVAFRELEVSDDPSFSQEPFLQVEEVFVQVRILPAILGRYEVERVVLHRPQITIVRGESGFSTDSLGRPAGEQAPVVPPDAGDRSRVLLIALAEIRDGRLRFIDSRGERPFELIVDRLDLLGSNLGTRESIRFEVSAGLHLLELVGGGVPQLTATGPIQLHAACNGSAGDLAVSFSLNASDAALSYEGLGDKPAGTPLEVELEGRLRSVDFAIQSATAKLGRAQIAASGRLSFDESLAYSLQIESEGLPLEGWEQRFEALDGLGLGGSLRLDLHVAGSAGQAGLPTISGTAWLDGVRAQLPNGPLVTRFSTVVSFANGGASIPVSSFELGGAPATVKASVADIARPVVVFEAAAPELTAASLGLSEDDDRVGLLRALELSGDASVGDEGVVGRVELRSSSGLASIFDYQNLAATLHYAGAIASIEKLSFEAYGGKIDLRGIYDLSNVDDPVFELRATLRQLRLEQFMSSQISADAGVLEGALDADLTLAGHGVETETIKRSLTGKAAMRLGEGVLRNINLADIAIKAIFRLPGLSALVSPILRAEYPAVFSSKDTIFDGMEGIADVRDGQLQFDELNLRARDFTLKGAGVIDLDAKVDIRATFSTSPALAKSLIGRSHLLRFITGPGGLIEVPLRVRGPIGSLKVSPDASDLATRIVRNSATRALSDLLQDTLGGGRNTAVGDPSAEGAREASQEEQRDPPPRPVDPLEELLRRAIGGMLDE